MASGNVDIKIFVRCGVTVVTSLLFNERIRSIAVQGFLELLVSDQVFVIFPAQRIQFFPFIHDVRLRGD